MSRRYQSTGFRTSLILLIVLIASSPCIASAYATHLNALGAITPTGGFQLSGGSSRPGGLVNVSSMDKDHTRIIVVRAPVVINSQTFLQRWLSTVQKNKTNLLWSSYPASIRGQVFTNSPAGGDPLQGGAW